MEEGDTCHPDERVWEGFSRKVLCPSIKDLHVSYIASAQLILSEKLGAVLLLVACVLLIFFFFLSSILKLFITHIFKYPENSQNNTIPMCLFPIHNNCILPVLCDISTYIFPLTEIF